MSSFSYKEVCIIWTWFSPYKTNTLSCSKIKSSLVIHVLGMGISLQNNRQTRLVCLLEDFWSYGPCALCKTCHTRNRFKVLPERLISTAPGFPRWSSILVVTGLWCQMGCRQQAAKYSGLLECHANKLLLITLRNKIEWFCWVSIITGRLPCEKPRHHIYLIFT